MTFWEVIGWAVAALVVAAVATVVIASIIGLFRSAKRPSRKASPPKALDVAEAYREARKLDPNMLPEQAYLLGAQWGHGQARGKSDA